MLFFTVLLITMYFIAIDGGPFADYDAIYLEVIQTGSELSRSGRRRYTYASLYMSLVY